MPTIDRIVVKLMVELISTLALVARKLKERRRRESLLANFFFTQCDAVKRVKNFFGVKEINLARQRLDRLLQEEDRAVGVQTLRAVEGG